MRLFALVAAALGAALVGAAPVRAAAPRDTVARPRLVLLVVVDQFRADYLTRFGDLFGPGGFRRLLARGALWTDVAYDYVPTETAPGHAALATGAPPSATGIVGNTWYDRALGRTVTSVEDTAAPRLASGRPGASAHRLLASTFADELRLATGGRAKTIGVSFKDRSAILPVGRTATAAYWFDPVAGRMTTSRAYAAAHPSWVEAFAAAYPAARYAGRLWERLLPEAVYRDRAGPDEPPWERGAPEPRFPHRLPARADSTLFEELAYTPFADELVAAFAAAALRGEGLGRDTIPDVLAVSFSAVDYVGHRYGPYSQELMDAVLRVDRSLAALLDSVDAVVGLDHTLVAVSADHGVAPIPEHAAALGLPGQRVGRASLRAPMVAALRAATGRADAERYLRAFVGGQIVLDREALRADGVDPDLAARALAAALERVPGLARCAAGVDLARTGDGDPLLRKLRRGYHPARSGDVLCVAAPYVLVTDLPLGASHGSPYAYDTRVPLLLAGPGVRPGRYPEPATPLDLAPTVAALLGLPMPSSAEGRILREALSAP